MIANNRVFARYTDPTTAFYPSAAIEGAPNRARIYVGGWSNSRIHRFDTAPQTLTGNQSSQPTFRSFPNSRTRPRKLGEIRANFRHRQARQGSSISLKRKYLSCRTKCGWP
jgi:hypothetical protein